VPSNEKFDELVGVAPEEAATSPRPRSGSFADMADNVKTAASEKATQAAEKAGEAAAAAKLKAKALAERTKDSIEVGSIMAEKGFYVGSRVVKEMLGVAKNSTAMPTEQETLANITEQWTRTAAYGVTFSETSKVGSTGQSPLGGWAHAGWSCVSQLCMCLKTASLDSAELGRSTLRGFSPPAAARSATTNDQSMVPSHPYPHHAPRPPPSPARAQNAATAHEGLSEKYEALAAGQERADPTLALFPAYVDMLKVRKRAGAACGL
jgi:hypothetical protein